MVNAINIAVSGLQAASKKMEAAASNIANAQTTGSLTEGSAPPYAAQTVIQESAGGQGVKAEIVRKDPPFTPAYDPGSALADGEGRVGAPSVDLAEEAVRLTLAQNSYKASLSVMETASSMENEMLRVFDRKV